VVHWLAAFAISTGDASNDNGESVGEGVEAADW
jgi:hypothetical protein